MDDPEPKTPPELASLLDALRELPREDPRVEDELRASVRARVVELAPMAFPSALGARPARWGMVVAAFASGVAVGVALHAWFTPHPSPSTGTLRVPTHIVEAPRTTSADGGSQATFDAPPDDASIADEAIARTDGGNARVATARRATAHTEILTGDDLFEGARAREFLLLVERMLDEGDAARALARLRAHERALPHLAPSLSDLREVLTVRALRDAGRVVDARDRADHFLAGHREGSLVREMRALRSELR